MVQVKLEVPVWQLSSKCSEVAKESWYQLISECNSLITDNDSNKTAKFRVCNYLRISSRTQPSVSSPRPFRAELSWRMKSASPSQGIFLQVLIKTLTGNHCKQQTDKAFEGEKCFEVNCIGNPMVKFIESMLGMTYSPSQQIWYVLSSWNLKILLTWVLHDPRPKYSWQCMLF